MANFNSDNKMFNIKAIEIKKKETSKLGKITQIPEKSIMEKI